MAGFRKDAVWAARAEQSERRPEGRAVRRVSRQPKGESGVAGLRVARRRRHRSPPFARTSATACGASCAGSGGSRSCSASAIRTPISCSSARRRDATKTFRAFRSSGRAGQKLTQIIEAIGLKREDVYIANVIKCRPPENRNPEPDEVEQCEPFLFRQVDTIKPKVIVALGTFAAKSLLKIDRLHLAAARPCVRLPRREARADVPSGVSPSQSELPARGVGGHEEGPRAPQRRRRGLIRCGWSPSPFPFHFSTFSRIRCPTASRLRRAARASWCRSASASSPASSSIRPRRSMPGRRRPTKSKASSKCWMTRRSCRAGGRSRAVGRRVLRVRRRRCARRGRAVDPGAQDDSHRDADRTGTRRARLSALRGPAEEKRIDAAARRAARTARARAQRHAASRPMCCSGSPRKADRVPSSAHRARSVCERRRIHGCSAVGGTEC